MTGTSDADFDAMFDGGVAESKKLARFYAEITEEVGCGFSMRIGSPGRRRSTAFISTRKAHERSAGDWRRRRAPCSGSDARELEQGDDGGRWRRRVDDSGGSAQWLESYDVIIIGSSPAAM